MAQEKSPSQKINPRYRNPYRRALISSTGLSGLFLLATLLALGLSAVGWIDSFVILIGLGFSILGGLILLVIWLLGWTQVRRAKSFLASNRPLVQWVYTPDEWQQHKETIWQEEHEDWKIQWGCLAVLFALVGLLAGGFVGLEDSVVQILESSIIGLVLGGLIGGTIGAVVAGSNHLAAKQAYHQSEPGAVALAPDEIFVIDRYFKGDGYSSYIRAAELNRGNPNTLTLEILFPPRPRLSSQEEWTILVPSQLIQVVEKALPSLIDSEAHENNAV
jgi:hypothetical protein